MPETDSQPVAAPLHIREVTAEDAAAIAEIYNYYIASSIVTFEEQPVSAEVIEQRIAKVKKAGLPWLVAEEKGELLGYIYAAPWHERSAFRFAAEASVYLSGKAAGKGLGRKLYAALFDELKETEIRHLMAVIALPNDASVALHEKLGFKKVGEIPEIGFKFNHWIAIGYWQLSDFS
ncbi:MAG: phosphinothricin acetyltransferase [Oceanospirillaceae bacterium]|nr:phosphinothricin acetyltransferase [Oceanospirillaceae bacterium]|tara:strand:+ start:1986 stop:2516 length:531 start_codon:yes stop_codon:yes gene_type:complete